MKKITSIVSLVGAGLVGSVLAVAPSAFAQTVSVPAATIGIPSDAQGQLNLLAVQVQNLVGTPILTQTQEAQELLILQSIANVLVALSGMPNFNNVAGGSNIAPVSNSNTTTALVSLQ